MKTSSILLKLLFFALMLIMPSIVFASDPTGLVYSIIIPVCALVFIFSLLIATNLKSEAAYAILLLLSIPNIFALIMAIQEKAILVSILLLMVLAIPVIIFIGKDKERKSQLKKTND